MMMINRSIFYGLLLLAFMLFAGNPLLARPVSYPDGWTTMLTNNGDRNALHIHYSPSINYSIGYKGEYWRDKDYTIHALQLNNLVKRWNMPAAQANFYVKSGVGIAQTRGERYNESVDPAYYTGLALDWENRRFFTSYENRFTQAGSLDDFYMQSARVGIAPYIGDYGDLHTWLMVDVEHQPESDKPFTVTPMVRLFKDVHLVEAGMSNKGELLFNYFIRF